MFPSHGGGRATGENSNVSPRPEDGARRGGGGDTSKHLLTQHPSFSSSHHHQCPCSGSLLIRLLLFMRHPVTQYILDKNRANM